MSEVSPPQPAAAFAIEKPEISSEVRLRSLIHEASGKLHFAFNGSELNLEARSDLEQIGDLLVKCPQEMIRVGGFTDNIGPHQYNHTLSHRRVQVVTELLRWRGVGLEQIQSEGYGERKPVATNKTESGRAQNRRVEIGLESAPRG